MKTFFIHIFLLSSTVTAFSQQVVPVLLTPLPVPIIESSGVETDAVSGAIWTHNDSGGMSEIYSIDTLGNLLRTLFLSGITNIDFEDITKDVIGNIYIGDIGNNTGNRMSLQIYKISSPSGILNDTIIPQQITYAYTTDSLQRLDCEAFFHLNQLLHLFTKIQNTGEYTKLFTLPDSAGTYLTTLVDSFYFSSPITAADISPDGNTVALLSYGKIYLLRAFSGNTFFNGTIDSLAIPLSQTEALAFIDNTSIYITDEKIMGTGGNLYLLTLPTSVGIKEYNQNSITIFPNPTKNKINFLFKQVPVSYKVEISNPQGELILSKTIYSTSTIDIQHFPKGSYVMKITNNDTNMIYYKKIIKQ